MHLAFPIEAQSSMYVVSSFAGKSFLLLFATSYADAEMAQERKQLCLVHHLATATVLRAEDQKPAVRPKPKTQTRAS